MNKRTTILAAALCLLVFSGNVNAQDTIAKKAEPDWTYKGFFSSQLNQASFNNWATGGQNAISNVNLFSLGAAYKKGNISWENNLDMGYGILKVQDTPLRKNEDKIDLISKFGRSLVNQWSATGLANFKSQFAPGYKYPNDSVVVSKFMAPGYLIFSLGIDYKPTSYLTINFSPATGKFTIVNDQTLADLGSYGVQAAVYDEQNNKIEDGKKVNPEFGTMLTIAFNKDIMENVSMTSKVTLFNNITDKDKANRKNTDVDWETNITMKINKFISASMIFHLLYDNDIPIPIYETIDGNKVQVGTGPRLQFKQVLGVGLSYKF